MLYMHISELTIYCLIICNDIDTILTPNYPIDSSVLVLSELPELISELGLLGGAWA